ncbi:MAG: hypothetical protein HYX61_07435 [Gammaproteobacteria bacterium]|jgi:hypothetical protein|nr:hypothetical protein [Gammaproteobacteria bacterium]
MDHQRNNERRKREQLLNVAVAAGGSWLLWYLSGPYAGDMGRWLYESVYSAIWGTPGWFSLRIFERAFVYNPNGSHLQHWLYDYAEYICPIIATPFLYKLPDLIRACFCKRLRQIESRLHGGHVEENTGDEIQKELSQLEEVVDELNSHLCPVSQVASRDNSDDAAAITPLKDRVEPSNQNAYRLDYTRRDKKTNRL